MAAGSGVWGIDIGQCALKAMRCSVSDDGMTVEADAFDFVEYPKILSQPEADPDELVREALDQFLSRNSVRGDKVAISVSGQSGLARFIKLPPVEAKKIPDIVKYEAKQQIPFALEDVIWDYQSMDGGNEEDGFALETEVGLFAMKRDQVFRAITPFTNAGIELDLVQLTPLAIYNFVAYDLLSNQVNDAFDPDNPPESLVVLSMGTDTTDLVVTNGFRVWQRSIPLGGNHFTRQLTKELKLTFAKAEHLKRNARQSEDPRAVFKAMRPVFNDLVTEVQRSIGYFQSLDRNAKIGRIIALGNAVKLPGLLQYLSKNLGYDVVQPDSYKRLTGASVVGSPAFQENLLSFAVSYGLCLQGLDEAKLTTSLLPREILTSRLVKNKKPWAVGALALIMLGLGFNYFFQNRAWKSVHEDAYKDALAAVASADNRKSNFQQTDEELLAEAEQLKKLGEAVVGNAERRLLWPELMRAIVKALPRDAQPNEILDFKQRPIDQRRDIHITKIESEYFPDLSTWFNDGVRGKYLNFRKTITGASGDSPAVTGGASPTTDSLTNADAGGTDPAATRGPAVAGAGDQSNELSGPGWVIEIAGSHHFNRDIKNQAAQYVYGTFLRNLDEGKVMLPAGPGKPPQEFTMGELGIRYPILIPLTEAKFFEHRIANPDYVPPDDGKEGQAGIGVAFQRAALQRAVDLEFIVVNRYDFLVQFSWQETPATQRLEAKQRADQPATGAVAPGTITPAGGP